MRINGFKPSFGRMAMEYPRTTKMALNCLMSFPSLLWNAVWESTEQIYTMVFLPGFSAIDATTLPARVQAWWRRHHPVSSGMRINLGVDDYVAAAFYRKMVYVYHLYRKPLVIVGHSLGGAIGNVFAHRYPEMVHMVITLGSPHKIPEEKVLVKKLIELVAGTEHLTNSRLRAMIENPAPVLVYAFTAWNDGFLPFHCTQVVETDRSKNFFFPGPHCGLIISPLVWKKIFELVQEPEIPLATKLDLKAILAKDLGLRRPDDYNFAWC